MKKKIRVILLLFFIGVICFLGYKIVYKINYKKEIAENIKTIPIFSFFDTKGNIYSNKNLPSKPLIFIYFNSDCNYCNSEATKIQKRLTDFKKVQLVFVSFEEQNGIISFAKKHSLYNRENIIFLEDKKGVFSQIFDVNSIPYIVVYDKDKNLLQKFKGATKIDNILEVLN